MCRKLNIIEVSADGNLGIMTGSPWDRFGVLAYAAHRGVPTGAQEILNFFGTDPGTYIDVGAHIGFTTIPIARNPRIRCIAFEPEPVNFSHT